MAIGRVKWFNNRKGYGFIETAHSGQDVFVHFSDILKKGYKSLKENEFVYFVLHESERGPSAHQVSPLSEVDADLISNEAPQTELPPRTEVRGTAWASMA